jgi:diacylglycerol kinase family enzyme
VLLLVNDHSGAVQREGAGVLTDDLQRLLHHAGARPRILRGDAPALRDRAAAAAAEHPEGVVVLVGGDGTLAAVGGALAGTATTLLPLPAGTANLLCRDLDLMGEPRAVLSRVLVEGRRLAIDVGTVRAGDETLTFLNQTVFGLYAELAALRERTRASVLDAVPDVFAGLFQAVSQEPQDYRVCLDGRPLDVRTQVFVVALGAYDRIDPPWPGRSDAASGELVAYLGRTDTPVAFATLLARCLATGLHGADELEQHHVREVRVDSDAPVHVSVDGEPRRVAGPVELTLAPGALQVIAGAEGPGS